MAIAFKELQKSENIAELLDEQELWKIADKIYRGYEYDEESRKEWREKNEEAMNIARQITQEKSYPWTGCANIQYPLITQAVIEFASRTYPEIIRSDRVVKVAVVGNDPDNQKFLRAQRVSKFQSFQILKLMDNWEGGLDQLLHMLPVLGTVFKKTYHDPLEDKTQSDLCHPERIVVNYNIQSLEKAARITHILKLCKNDIVSRMRSGIYLDIPMDRLFGDEYDPCELDDECDVLEQCCWLDLDEDGYAEPYIVTQHKDTKQILKIINRFKDIEYTKDKKIIKIVPYNYYTDFHFIPSPDGGFYSLGLGALLLHLNKTVNSILNNLVDAGTLNNMQSGFIDSKVRLKNGEVRLQGGEFKVVQVGGLGRLSDYVEPLPTKEPSQTLFQLMGMLITASKDLVSNTDLLKGKGETQNVPATTTMAMIEQGLKLYTAIVKRLFLALGKEFTKIFECNKEYLSNELYREVLDDPSADVQYDFNYSRYDISTIADPNAATDAQRMVRSQALFGVPGLDMYWVKYEYLEALGYESEKIAKLLPPPDPNAPPPPEVQKIMAEVQKLSAEAQLFGVQAQTAPVETQLEVVKVQQDAKESESRIMESQGRVMKMQHDAAVSGARVQVEAIKNQNEKEVKIAEVDADVRKHISSQSLKEQELEVNSLLEYKKLLQDANKKVE